MTDQNVASLLRYRTQEAFRANLDATLKVAGPGHDEHGEPQPLSSVQIHARTGVARTTLRALRSSRNGNVNPDLQTICRLAEAMDIPPAFLLMRPQDWNALGAAYMQFQMYLEAAAKALSEGCSSQTNEILESLRKLTIHGQRPAIGSSYGASTDNYARLAREEYRRRSSFQWKALISQEGVDPQFEPYLTAIAASVLNTFTTDAPGFAR